MSLVVNFDFILKMTSNTCPLTSMVKGMVTIVSSPLFSAGLPSFGQQVDKIYVATFHVVVMVS